MKRYLFLFVFAAFVVRSVTAQPAAYEDTSSISRIEYTRLDGLSKDQSRFFTGERSEVNFRFIELRNITAGEAIYGVEVAISDQDQEVVGGSLGLAVLGSMWGSSTSVTYQRIESSGHILLDPKEVGTVVDFMNSILGALGENSDKFRVFKVALQDRFEMGMMYDPDYTPQGYSDMTRGDKQRNKWRFTVTADGVTYTLDYPDGIEVLQKLIEWEDRMQQLIAER